MATQPGFLQSFGISPVDEKDSVTAQRDALLNKVEQARTAQGRTAGRGVAGLLGGASSIIRNRSFKGVGAAIGQSFAEATDRDVAEASGLTVEQLRGRREIRALSSSQSNSGSFANRISLARQIAAIANRSGDSDVLGSALKRITDLQTEQREFDKLNAQTTSEEQEAFIGDVREAWSADGTPTPGVDAVDKDGNKGLNISTDSGVIFKQWGEGLLPADPNKNRQSNARHISSTLGKSVFNKVRGILSGQFKLTRKYDGVLTLLSDVGDIEGVVGDTGRVTAWIDNKVLAIQGILTTFVPSGTLASGNRALARLKARNTSYTDSAWAGITLPESVRTNSKEAQAYRAAIMDISYAVAQTAEPSNRGLSDGDIIRAMERIGGESGDPEVFIRRAFTMIAEGMDEVEDELSLYHEMFKPDGISNEEVDTIMAGGGLIRYRGEIGKLYKKHNIAVDSFGRPNLANPLLGKAPAKEGDADFIEEVTDDEFNEAMLSLFPKEPEGR